MSKTKTRCTKCAEPTVGNSRYCVEHRRESRANFKLMMADQQAARDERNAMFDLIWQAAVEGAVKAATPNAAPGAVVVRPSNCAYANWLVKQGYGTVQPYDGGKAVLVLTDDVVGAGAMANTIREHDIRALAITR